MSIRTSAEFAAESKTRLTLAEQSGLRLAIAVRTCITGLAFAWYVGAPWAFPEFEPRVAAIVALLLFTAIGIAHLFVIGTRFDRWWMKYGVYAVDTLSICATFALIPISRADDIPQIIAFRAYGVYYLFPILAIACLSLSWRLVLWTGLMCIIGWWAAFLVVSLPMTETVSWADIPSEAMRSDYEAVFLSMNFIGRGNRIEESAMILFTSIGLATAVYRARRVFFAQVASELEWKEEKQQRERVSALLGKYVPQEIAEQLIADSQPLEPQTSAGTALVMDIAGFTRFSAQRPPEEVIGVLDAFLSDTTEAVANERGIVISYAGDGFLVTFNAPVKTLDPAGAAIRTAQALIGIASQHGFEVRIGIASGALVTGTIGTDQRQSFTVYGDPVNLAARLESHCKSLKCPILLDHETHILYRGPSVFERHTDVEIRGLSAPITVFAFHPLMTDSAQND